MKPLGKSFTMMCFVLQVWRGSSRSSHTRNRGRRASSSAFGAHVPPRPLSLSLHRPAGAFLFQPKVPPSSSLHPHSSMRGDRLRNCDAGSSSTVPLLSLSHRHCRQHFSSSTLSLAAASSSDDMREGEGVSPSMKRKVVNEVYDSLFYVPTNHPSGDKREDDQGRASVNSSGSGQYSFYDGGGESSPSQRPRAQASSRQSQRSTNSNMRNQQSQTTQQNTIQTTRALYQFRALQPGSSRIMPPRTNSYDEELYDYNIGEDSLDGADVASGYYKTVNDELDNVTRKARIISKKHGAETQSKQKGNATASSPRLMDVRETSFFDEDVKGKPAESSERPSVRNFFDDEDDTKIATPSQPAPVELSTSMPTTTSSTSAAATPLPKPPLYRGRNITPSFMEPTKIKGETSNLTTDKTPIVMDIASNGISITSHLTALEYQLEHLTTQIYQLNGGVEFNVNSPKQVARVLFGDGDTGDTSTNKDVLESLASAGNEMAASIYKYRKLSREIKREQKRIEQQEKGDKKNDYYGNLARHEQRIQNTATSNDVQMFETVTPPEQSQSAVTNTADGQSRREPLLLIDASAYIFRAYHAIPPLHHSDGTPTGALHGVCRMLQNLLLTRLLAGDRPRVVLAFDYKGPNFRHEIYPEYKANRGPCPEDLAPQFDLVREAAEALGVMIVEAEGYEADDVIATLAMLALEEGVDVDIFSGDKDLMQLITPPNSQPSVHMIDPLHYERVDHDDVVKKWGVPSEKLGDVLALAGDASDNIPGAPGIGPKIAQQLITEYGSLNDLLSQAESIKQKKRRESVLENREKLQLFRQLVALDDSIPISKLTSSSPFQDLSSLRMRSFNPDKLLDFYERMQLNACQRQLQKRLRSSRTDFKQPPTPEEFANVPF